MQAGYDWSDTALDARVRAGLEIPFCAEMMRLELPDRSDLEIVVPTETFAEYRIVDLGGVQALLHHVGGDHAADSSVVHVPGDDVLFLGDCLYQRLHAPVPFLTVAGVRALLAALAPFAVTAAVEGHQDTVTDAAGYAARLGGLREAAALVEAHGADAAERAGDDEDLNDLVSFLLVGEALT